ncbi:hypothetical protein NM680_09535 [Paracoccus sp. PS-1]|uniref:hypothetical protein n=1 Tax=unclassified Paracoccus (in: a-proteobacteria) TaxID=2688777 RepID=UPI0012EC175A|nr:MULTISPECIES: hypothetical protein [unclassified Paracoccus (in: a-proteobacteria)]MDQ7262036.1 hypothetical protein [Paracoccus sp. PS1]
MRLAVNILLFYINDLIGHIVCSPRRDRSICGHSDHGQADAAAKLVHSVQIAPFRLAGSIRRSTLEKGLGAAPKDESPVPS